VSEFEYSESIATAATEQRPAGPTLGLLLRKAREARGLSIEDAVHALKFRARQIEAVEADRMDMLPGSVFARGLVRSYARFLKLDPEPLLALIEASAPVQEPEIRAPENMGNAGPRGGIFQLPPLVLVSFLLIIAMIGMLVWHYFGSGAPSLPIAFESPKPVVQELKPVESATPSVQGRAEVIEMPTPAPAPVVTREPATAPTPVSAATPQAAETPVLPTDTRRLSFEFRGESWIEVKDASGLVILTGIYSSGTQSAAGRPPFEVIVGNASVVTVRDSGHPVDLKPHTRSEVARFTLE
jgi:cytoskeleton protein RodZ